MSDSRPSSRSVLEVVALWGDQILVARHLEEGALVLGDAPGALLAPPPELLGAPSLALATCDAAGWTVHVPAAASATRGGAPIEGRCALAESDPPIVVALGAVALRLALVPRERALPPLGWRQRIRRSGTAQIVGSALAHLALLGMFAGHVPGLADEEGSDPRTAEVDAIRQYLTAQAEREEEARHDGERGPDAPSGRPGERAAGEEGKTGAESAPARRTRVGIAGPPDAHPVLSRERQIAEASTFGILGMLEGASGPRAPSAAWGALVAIGNDAKTALGNLFGDSIDDAAGVGGLGLTSTGEGGGGPGKGIGLTDIAGLGGGLDPWGKDPGGLGRCRGARCGAVQGKHVAGSPLVRMAGPVHLDGHLPPEVIQRIVRQSFGRFRGCYEAGLRANPALAGRVTTRFVIDRTGTVTQASDGGSDLPDAAVVACVTRAFYGLSFPENDTGVVRVSYPIAFSPE